MQSDISDEELRAMLSKYLDVVPPVTETTRNVLVSKLEKFLIAEVQQEQLEPADVDVLSTDVLITSPTKSKKVPNSQTETLSASEQIPDSSPGENASGDYAKLNADGYSISFESPKEKSSPVYEYVSRMPNYRRRSIHPDRPGLDSPYADFALPDARSFVSPITHYRQPKQARVLGIGSEGFVPGRRLKDWLYVPFSLAVSFVEALWFVITNAAHQFKNSAITSRVSFRLIIYLLAFGLLAVIAMKFLYGDPFYHNPVNDLHNWMQRRRV
ncbi:Lamino-associated polypeptide 2/emerin domain-containing protein [Fasciola hepatica]|uniref:Lamino-associated polypeptide 2/emerin domain-containing protein n=1 Tax=Fasciola hepatica TaxID=6192 RepID=A0A4E0RWI8_FASHE|nr:Lamino-associated polypeptide 2/emerin domain-containing protein [Fasciola hepatica]